MLKTTLYLVILRGRPAIDLLFDTLEDAQRYVDTMDGRRIRHNKAAIAPLSYYSPTQDLQNLKRVRMSIVDILSELDGVKASINKTITNLGG